MIGRPPPQFTIKQYLAVESVSQYKNEFYQGQILDLARMSLNHIHINGNLVIVFGNQLKGSAWTVLGSQMRVKTPTLTYIYPDCTIVYGDPKSIIENDQHSLTNPRLLVEVCSPSTEQFDKASKFDEYCSIPTFDTYVLVAEGRPHVELREEINANTWQLRWFDGLDTVVQLANPGIQIMLADLYINVDWSDEIG